jgi:hypothetical protein
MDAKFGNQVGTDPQKPSSAAARFLAVFGTERETKPEANNRNMSTTLAVSVKDTLRIKRSCV